MNGPLGAHCHVFSNTSKTSTRLTGIHTASHTRTDLPVGLILDLMRHFAI